ncbi:helix-turn-helix domain-containing protein [Paenibacillus alba]|uniref:Helix-turn-helix domain-containing protein n=1 Tax=Paenibacillus alba TaxID=1197127 RepID=A0ABU6G8L1_9BACL|nr:helix-turn-helix domain-containing protein [Paenibacillus alba]MEC0229960.1 helix-turn-helix domain-containing protein [Paenibacillus alba]
MSEILRVDYRMLSPYVRYVHEVELPAGSRLPKRHIYDYEFIYVLKGSGTIWIEERSYAIRSGDLVHIRPHLVNEMLIADEAPMLCFAVHFDYVFLGEGLEFSPYSVYLGRKTEGAESTGESWLGNRPTVVLAEMEIPEKMQPLAAQQFYEVFRELRHCFEESRTDAPLRLKTLLLQLIGLIHSELMSKEGVRIGHSHADLVLDAITYMEAHFTERISSGLLAKRAALTPKYFGTIFRQATGQSVADYLLRLRMEDAKRLLRLRKYSVQEIAEIIGIGDLYYFSKLFKRVEGIPPKRYADSISWLERGNE